MCFVMKKQMRYSVYLLLYLSSVVCYQMSSYESYLDRIKKQAIQNRQRQWNQTSLMPQNQTSRVVLIDPQSLFGTKPKSTETWNFEANVQSKFSNIGGYHEIKEELYQIKDLLQNRDLYQGYSVRTPKGLLLEGPPGNGKTLLAKCFAGECGFNFLSVSGAEFNEKYVGVGAQRVREVFQNAKKNQPCVVFIDELDAIGAKRSVSDEGASTERFQTLNQLLVSMDGFDSENMKEVFVIGATNRKDILDPALLRSGRFDKIVHVPNPDEETRQEIIDIHRIRKPITLSTAEILDITDGLSGADIENMLNEVSLWALRKNKTVDSISLLDNVRDKIILGTKSVRSPMTDELEERVAMHECGHLLVGLMSVHHENPTKVTIESSGSHSLGYTYFTPNHQGLYSKQYLREKLMILLAGKVAEGLFFEEETSTGSMDDLQRATMLARQMILDYGMVSRPVYSLMSDRVKALADQQIQQLLEECYHEVESILMRNKSLLLWISKRLVHYKSMNKQELKSAIEIGKMLYPSQDLDCVFI